MSDEKYSKYLPKENKSYFIANAILESICFHNKINKALTVSEFDKSTDFYSWNEYSTDIFEIFKNSPNILKDATRVIRALKILETNKRKYTLSTENWFNGCRFIIHDNNVLKELSQILLYYVGNCENKEVCDFFEKLDFLIDYVIKPSLEHNKIYEKELLVIKSLKNDIDILDENEKVITVTAIQLKLIRTSLNKIEKVLVYETYDDSQLREISIDRVVLKQKISNEKRTNGSFNPMLSYKTYNDYEEKDIKPKKEKYIDVVLECSTTLFEYFQMKPLKNMKVYSTQEELEEFHQTIEYKPKNNKFYIVASDREDMILSTVLHSLPYAVIVNNNDLNDKLIKRFKDYANEADIDICPPTPPNEPSSSSSNNEPKKEERQNSTKKPKTQLSKEQQKKLNKEHEDINKDNDKLF